MSLIKLAQFTTTIGLGKSWQMPFPKTTKCSYCGNEARIGLTIFENYKKDDKFICDLHKNKKNELWPHDCVALANYFCTKCLRVTTLFNQA